MRALPESSHPGGTTHTALQRTFSSRTSAFPPLPLAFLSSIHLSGFILTSCSSSFCPSNTHTHTHSVSKEFAIRIWSTSFAREGHDEWFILRESADSRQHLKAETKWILPAQPSVSGPEHEEDVSCSSGKQMSFFSETKPSVLPTKTAFKGFSNQKEQLLPSKTEGKQGNVNS